MQGSQLGQDQVPERWVDLGFDREVPPVLARECAAFYCILLRHQDYIVFGEGEIIGAESKMIGKRVGAKGQPHALQMGKEALWVPDSGDGVQRLVPQVWGRDSKVGIQQVLKAVTREFGKELGSAQRRQLPVAVDEHRVDRVQAAD
jgi:hypothetical protein